MVLCPAVFAGCSAGLANSEEAQARFESTGIFYDAFSSKSAFLAGEIFLRYRQEGGSRQHLIPDFLIDAHAWLQADRLAAVDRGYLRTYFPKFTFLKGSD